jgi:hypothetical protein
MEVHSPTSVSQHRLMYASQLELHREVVCGPIHKFFVYYTDNLVSKGANVMIEAQRRGDELYCIVCNICNLYLD